MAKPTPAARAMDFKGIALDRYLTTASLASGGFFAWRFQTIFGGGVADVADAVGSEVLASPARSTTASFTAARLFR